MDLRYYWAITLALFLGIALLPDGAKTLSVFLFVVLFIVTAIKTVIYLLGKGVDKGKSFFKPSTEKEFERFISEVVDLGEVSSDIERRIIDAGLEIGLTEERIDSIRRERCLADVDKVIEKIVSTKRFTFDDEERINLLGKLHGIDLKYEDPYLDKYRSLFLIETTGDFEMKPINADINLVKSEECYFMVDATWKQQVRVRESTGYIGGSLGVKVAKGVTLRLGKAVPTYKEYDDTKTLSVGKLYITNKKVIFIGNDRSTNITNGRIATYELYKDAIKIVKTSGKPDIFSISDTDEVLMLDAVLQKLGQ